MKKIILSIALIALFANSSFALNLPLISSQEREVKRKESLEKLQEEFRWWPTDAQPGPVKDERGGYWWWPKVPGEMLPWGNRGYIYVFKIIFDYKAEELPPPKKEELRPALLIRKIIKNVKVYFDFDKADLREDGIKILDKAVKTLEKNPRADILITGNCDIRGPEAYNLKLGARRAEAVKKFMQDKGIREERIKIVSRGKLDAVAAVTDLVGLQKDRNAQFMIAEVEEIMLPYAGEEVPPPEAKIIDEGKFLEEKQETLESEVKVATKEYIVQKDDSLWKIAVKEYGNGHQWQRIYNFNKDRIKNPARLTPGQKIILPIE
jgi:outer membrane protein OmpA-like peptidoglycan-associated protein